ncbi:HNH/ENDO VII family nuclease [Phyllobacterium leguminum]|uniref:HNH/ENDO VII superfamily nuclease n=1 Tax=Phyllobacterium leguminum TaxID=314237 RepID=A0A318SXP9_9HYPH|nr:HNH/ENDO VII family nuclease [Phyllobacterium leguminum]PYE85159.1 HNH/ENDO VII superfamily nuclease [Phyllobacterium leguminum]
MAEAGLAPAAHPDNSFLSQSQNTAVYAQNRHNELLAQLRFMGLLCGIKGPNGKPEDVANARNAVIEALSDFLASQGGPLAQQVQQDYDRYLEMRQGLDLFNRFGTAEAIDIGNAVNNIGRLGHPADNAPFLGEIADGKRMPDVGNGRISQPGIDYISQAHGYYQSAAKKQQQLNAIVAERRRQWWNSVWENLTSYYNARLAEIKQGRMLEAVAKPAIDAAYVVAEELIYAGMISAIVAITGGAAATIGIGLRMAISIGSRSARFLTRAGSDLIEAAARQAADTIFDIRITKVEPAALPGQGQPGRLLHRQQVDVEKDLTPEEAAAFGEGGLGSTRPDADAPEQGPSGNSNRQAQSGNRWQAREVNGRRVYQRDDLIDPNFVDPDTGLTNLEHMRAGRPPIGPDGNQIELHHMVQQEGLPFTNDMAPLAEVERSFHSKNYNAIHIYPRGDPDYISWRKLNPSNARRYDNYRRKYWPTRAKDFEPD